MKEVYQAIVHFCETAGWQIVTFLAVLTGGIIVIRLLCALVRKALTKSPVSGILSGFIAAVVRFALWLVLLFVLAAVARIPAAPLVTALGALGLALSLAVKDSLANLANGIVLMGTKPFQVGDYVDIDQVSGTVKAIKMMSTELITTDNKKVLVPNGKITTASIVNYSAKQNRRVQWDIRVAYGTDVQTVKETVLRLFAAHPKILTVPEPACLLDSRDESSLLFLARGWVLTPDYWDVYWDINERINAAFAEQGIRHPYRRLDVQVRNKEEQV